MRDQEGVEPVKPEAVLPYRHRLYACDRCGFVKLIKTNHAQGCWSAGRYNTCDRCPPWAKYTEFGGRTTWSCLESHGVVSFYTDYKGEPLTVFFRLKAKHPAPLEFVILAVLEGKSKRPPYSAKRLRWLREHSGHLRDRCRDEYFRG